MSRPRLAETVDWASRGRFDRGTIANCRVVCSPGDGRVNKVDGSVPPRVLPAGKNTITAEMATNVFHCLLPARFKDKHSAKRIAHSFWFLLISSCLTPFL